MTAQIRSELIKLSTTRATWVTLAAAAAAGALAGTVFTAPISEGQWVAMHEHPFLPMYVTVAGLFAYALGARVVTDEFRHGTATWTFLATPRRGTVVGAKAVTGIAAGVVTVLTLTAATIGVVARWMASNPGVVSMPAADAALMVATILAAAAGFGVLGVGVASMVRNPVATIVGGFGWFLILEGVASGLLGEAARYLPGAAAAAIVRAPVLDPLTRAEGAVMFGLFVLAAAIAGTLVTKTRDVV